jgi:RNA exonuclease 4
VLAAAESLCRDAIKSIRLFAMHQHMHAIKEQWQAVEQMLLATQPEPSFARKNPSFEGVCMGNRKTCTCGAPFFG